MSILEKVNEPKDFKNFTISQLTELADDVRALIIDKVSKVGGHFGPNMAVVEMIVALHKVFNSPVDKFIWDVSHQSYPHKVLTGRKSGFTDGHFHDVTGFTSQAESAHDFFTIGHTSTSVANAVGLAHARDLTGTKGNVIAIIGDGSLSGGLALEALNNAGDYTKNLIIIANDNEMSIAENHGGLYKSLADLRNSNGTSTNNIFKAFNLDYRYLENGHDMAALVALFEEVKDIDHPIVLHIHTEKGHGYTPSLDNKIAWHWHSPFDKATGLSPTNTNDGENFVKIVNDFMDEKLADGVPLVAINAAIPGIFNLKDFESRHPHNYVDVGIAEQYSITYGGALAAGGARPIIFHNSTFLQRAYDQLWHDLAINNEPAIVIVKGNKIDGSDVTHQGDFGLGMITNIPNLVTLAPTSSEELLAMLAWGISQTDQPVIIFMPEHGVVHRLSKLKTFEKPVYDVVKTGEKVAILGLGGLFSHAEKAVLELEKSGISATLVNPLFAGDLDKVTLTELASTHDLIVTIEDGVLAGGFGEKVSAFLGKSDVKVLNFGADKEFNDSVPLDTLYERYHLTIELLVADILASL
ncbi:1-deoxy-D-xylulose-5-phosphate synthase [Lactococcus hodotermopsidis]|uniref:1-deoxy-D-xylulose-5-phosphate synthase n=1 Tax=Pseudolactococcus hodotermopsidis TaxID=2709157 RepID=A0A6A0BB31_9LACT|nr:1-deoxy-D-xylulose-5-phosphate synthase [Lactococcus hodotermopsidis]GFH42649.1 1-deoxy-D-xylulose-5-phosphate synthase [Lactococcus hodotermopsidis]